MGTRKINKPKNLAKQFQKKHMFLVGHGAYPFDVLVCINYTSDEVIKYVENELNYPLNDKEAELLQRRPNSSGLAVMLEGGQSVLQIASWGVLHKNLATLTHEAFHLVEFLFNRVNVQYELHVSSEVWAYQIDHIINHTIHALEYGYEPPVT
jgi:hypothetical protein